VLMLVIVIVLEELLFDYEHEHVQEHDDAHIPIIW
jgi:hypothetical protein